MAIPDMAACLAKLDRFDLTREQKEGFIHTLHDLAQAAVDRAFEEHPVQLSIRDASESNLQGKSKPLDSTHSHSFNDVAACVPRKGDCDE